MSRLRTFERMLLAWFLLNTARNFRLRKFWQGILNTMVRGAKALPGVGKVIQGEVQKEVAKIEKKMLGEGDPAAQLELPSSGMPAADVITTVTDLKKKEESFYTDAKKWAGIYHDVSEKGGVLTDLQNTIWGMFNSTNALYPAVFPSIRKFEAEIVAMCLDLLHAGRSSGFHGNNIRDSQQPVGLLTSGGTESILIAVHAYRELARTRGIEDPEIVCCVTAHPALDKASHYFGVRLVKVDADPSTQQLPVESTRKALTKNTVAIYASAPTFPHGVVDPIEELSSLAVENHVGLHVDNCLGGFYLSFLQRQGLFKHKFDFELPGVTTISIDVHKYGFASKGVSVVAFRSPELRRLSYIPVSDGLTLYITPTLQGARGGATMATAWATMLHIGADGYAKAAAELREVEQAIKTGIEKTPGIRLLCSSDLSVIPIASDDPNLDIYAVATLMDRRGWSMFTARRPPCMSLCIGERHAQLVGTWLTDVHECIAELRQNPNVKPEGDAAVYGTADMLPSDILEDVLRSYVDIKMSVKPKL